MQNISNRIEWIDALKGYAIICVTLGHLGCNFFLEKHIYSFHMFIFFLLSAYVDKCENLSYTTYLIKKTKNILIPFVVWAILSALVSICSGESAINALKTMFILNEQVGWNASIWFLPVIFITQILYAFFKKFLHINDLVLLITSLFIWLCIPSKNMIFRINLIPMSICFYVFGIIYKKLIEPRENKIMCKKIYVCAVLCFLLSINILFGVILNVRIVFTKNIFGNILFCFIGAIAGTLFYVTIFKKCSFLGKNKLLNHLGQKSLIIMISQFYLFKLYNMIMGDGFHIFRNDLKALFLCVITITIITLISDLIIFFGNKNKYVKDISNWFGF